MSNLDEFLESDPIGHSTKDSISFQNPDSDYRNESLGIYCIPPFAIVLITVIIGLGSGFS